jgi:hypothetical protein
MANNVAYLIAAIIYIAILFTLVRPHSKGPAIVTSITGTLVDLVRGATGETFNGTSWSTGT